MQSVGIGGGTLINVLLIQGFGYSGHQSTTLAYVFLMGGALATTLVSSRTFTPQAKPLLNYQLILLALPTLISGSILGVPDLSI